MLESDTSQKSREFSTGAPPHGALARRYMGLGLVEAARHDNSLLVMGRHTVVLATGCWV